MLTTFLTFLLCAITSCDPKFDPPEIIQARNPRQIPSEPFVSTKNGDMVGYVMTSMSGRPFNAFEGIRFGMPPVNEDKFRDPKPSWNWHGVYQAKKPGPLCLQMSVLMAFGVTGNEDCLFLSVYTAKLPDVAYHPKLPVIFYIHGGAFHQGSTTDQGPTYLLDKDVVVVMISYRLGILGFLSTLDENNPGNWGLKDQALALKWTYENIDRFGGDPSKITVMGQSAGASSSHFHLMSLQTKKYIRSAVSISGNAFSQWAMNSPKRIKHCNDRLASLLGCSAVNSKTLMDCIRNVRSEFLVSVQFRFQEEFYDPTCLFVPVVEPDLPGAFLSETPTDAYLHNNVSPVPWINTMTREEAHTALFAAQAVLLLGRMRKRYKEIVPVIFRYKYEIDNVTATTEAIAKFYTGSPIVENLDIDHFSQMYSDRSFTYAIAHSSVAHSRIAPTYVYCFSYRGGHRPSNLIGIPSEEWGVGHGEDLFYFFNSSVFQDGIKQSDPDYRISKLMINLLYNFVEKGEPYYTNEDGLDYKIWEPIDTTSDTLKYLQIDKETKMIPDPFKLRVKFWEDLGLPDMQKWHFEDSNSSIYRIER